MVAFPLLLACTTDLPTAQLPADSGPIDGAALADEAAARWVEHHTALDQVCVTMVKVGFPARYATADIVYPNGSVEWGEREFMGAGLRSGRYPTPMASELEHVGLSSATHRMIVATLGSLNAENVHTWDVTTDGGGYHPWIVIRSDVVFVFSGYDLLCRQGALAYTNDPDPLWGAGWAPIAGAGDRWWYRAGGS